MHNQMTGGGNIQVLRRQAQQLLMSGDHAGAESVLRQILQRLPRDADVLASLGQINFMRGEWAAATEELRKADRLKPDVWQIKYMLGVALWERQEFSVASQVLGKAVRLIPEALEPVKRLTARILAKTMTMDEDPVLWGDALHFLSQRPDVKEWILFVKGCGYRRGAPQRHNERIFVNLIIPLIKFALSRGELRQALELHVSGLVVAALSPHTEEQWTWCFSRLNPLFVEAGERLCHSLPAPAFAEAEPAAMTPAPSPVVAYIVDRAVVTGSGLVMLMHILEQVAPSRKCPVTPVVYTVQGTSPELAAKCQSLGIPLVDFDLERGLPYGQDDLGGRLVAIRERSRQDRVSVAAFFSTYEGFVCLASSLGLAPAQIYLTMGYHSLDAPRIDAYLACISLNRGTAAIHGRPWKTLPFPFPNPFPATDSPDGLAQAKESVAIREALLAQYDVILGTLARPEKLDGQFIDTLTEILRQNPKAVFLWFGRQTDTSDVAMHQRLCGLFEQLGIGERCLFRGWVDTKVYARVLDIHLDCFTLPTGLTMAETFSAGTAYALMRGADANVGMRPILASVLDAPENDRASAEARRLFVDTETGANLLMLAETAEQYIANVNHMIRDKAFRAKVGAAAAHFMQTYFHDSSHMGRVFAEIIAEVMDEVKQRAQGYGQ